MTLRRFRSISISDSGRANSFTQVTMTELGHGVTCQDLGHAQHVLFTWLCDFNRSPSDLMFCLIFWPLLCAFCSWVLNAPHPELCHAFPVKTQFVSRKLLLCFCTAVLINCQRHMGINELTKAPKVTFGSKTKKCLDRDI